MSQRQSRQAKHIQSIQKIFTQYDDKLQLNPASPQPPSSPYGSSRFAIHRPKSPNGPRRNHIHQNINKRIHENELEPPKKTMGNEPQLSPVVSIGSMFDSNKKSSIADLHKTNIKNAFGFNTNDDLNKFNIPDKNNTDALLNEFEKETKNLRDVCTNYENVQTSLSQIVRQQSLCIKQLLKELDKKNHQIRELQSLLAMKSESTLSSPSYVNHKTILSPKNKSPRINRKFQKHSMNKKRQSPPNMEYEQIIRHVPIV